MRHLILFAGVCAVAACGPSEDEIRAEERAKVLEERVKQLEEERVYEAAAKAEAEKSDKANETEETESESVDAPEPQTARNSSTPQSKIKGSPGGSARLITSYNAYIGDEDLYNSNGTRLTAPWQVLRQDRANYHRYGVAQPGDQSDPFFGSGSNRAVMERMVANGSIEANAGRAIVSGNVGVRVEVYENGSGTQWVNVTVR